MGRGRIGLVVFVLVSEVAFADLPEAQAESCSVESQGRTLEELEWVYAQPNPVKASLQMQKVVIHPDGEVVEIVSA